MNIFKSRNPLKDYHVKIYEIDNYFHERYKKKIKCDKDGNEYIFEIVIYFNDYSLVVDIDEKKMNIKSLFLN